MKQIGDLQRLVSKVALRKIGPRECLTLGYGLDNLADCKVLLKIVQTLNYKHWPAK